MPKVTEAHRQARRRQILMAAFTCFGRDGIHGTTMQDVCEEADLSAGAVYNYFEGKADIVQALANESRGSLDTLFDRLDRDQSAPEVIAGLLERLGDFVEEPGDSEGGGHRVRVRLWGEALSATDVKEPFQENLADVIERIAKVIRNGQQDETIAQDVDPEAVARAVLAFHHGMVLQKALSPDMSVEAVFNEIGALVREASA